MLISPGTRLVVAFPLLAFLISVSGCASDLNSPTAQRLKAVANLYLYLAASNKGTGPSSEEHFRKFFCEAPDVVFQTNRVKSVGSREQMLVSERDGQPFVIRCDVSVSGMTPTSAPVIAYEKDGKNGKHLLAYANGNIDEVNSEKLSELTAESK